MTGTDLEVFRFEDQKVRVVTRDGEPWWVARDVCDVLGIKNVTRAISGLDDDEKGLHSVNTLGGDQEVAAVNEAGLYSLVLRSRKPQAHAFKRWITHEVLPALRKTGNYTVAEHPEFGPQTFSELREVMLEIAVAAASAAASSAVTAALAAQPQPELTTVPDPWTGKPAETVHPLQFSSGRISGAQKPYVRLPADDYEPGREVFVRWDSGAIGSAVMTGAWPPPAWRGELQVYLDLRIPEAR